MKKFTLEIECENDAFRGRVVWEEIARILRHTAKRVENEVDDGKLFDINGNSVGRFTLTEE